MAEENNAGMQEMVKAIVKELKPKAKRLKNGAVGTISEEDYKGFQTMGEGNSSSPEIDLPEGESGTFTATDEVLLQLSNADSRMIVLNGTFTCKGNTIPASMRVTGEQHSTIKSQNWIVNAVTYHNNWSNKIALRPVVTGTANAAKKAGKAGKVETMEAMPKGK